MAGITPPYVRINIF